MTDFKPSGKTGLTGAAGAAVTILVFIGERTGFDIPADVAVAVVTLVMLAVAYFVPARSGTHVEPADLDWDNDALGSMGDYSYEEETR